MLLLIACCFTAVLFIAGPASAADQPSRVIKPVALQCEYLVNPLGVDVTKPRLSWQLESDLRGQRQAAYQILVASTAEKLQQNEGDLWDTGRIDSDETIHVEYEGETLKSGQQCFWKVRSWPTRGGDASATWSEPASWEMALVDPSDWKAVWINDGRKNPDNNEDLFKTDPAPLFRKNFDLKKPVRNARLYITGLGYYDAQLNGLPVGDHELDPGWTNYSKRVYYSTYDVTDQLAANPEGDTKHCLAVTVGNGWYNPLPLRMWGHRDIRKTVTVGRPRLIAQLEIEFMDGTTQLIASDTTWKTAPGPMLRNSVYLGEVYDARREPAGWNRSDFNDSDWADAASAEEPIGLLQAQPLEPIRVTAKLKPVKLSEPKPGVFIYDMGQNFGGRVSLRLDVPESTTIDLRYGELLNEDGTLNPKTAACGQIKGAAKYDESGRELEVWDPVYPSSAWQGDRYIAKGVPGETYTPCFTFHAFRYVEVTGLPSSATLDMVEGYRMNSDVASAGEFACSSELLNEIQKICQWTFLSNIFSVQSDCPHRERFGYGGDVVNTCDAYILNYDMVNFYNKATWDWDDAKREDGMLTDTAPFVGIQYCGVGWAMVHPLLQQKLYQYYGDRRLVEQQYATAKRWLDLVDSNNEDHIIKRGLSDHESLTPKPSPQMVTPLYCESARILSELASVLGKEAEAEYYTDLSRKIRDAWYKQFVDNETGVVSPDTQAIHAFALYLDMLPEDMRAAALKHLIDDIVIDKQRHLSTGIFGTKYALDVLSREGYSELAYDVVSNRDFPGWGYMIDNGATTLWEHWAFSDNTFSHNHPMFGSVSQWFFNWLGGIQVEPDSVGFNRIALQPQFVKDLDWVNCRYDSIRGPIACNWKRVDGAVLLNVEIPVNTVATLHLPVSSDGQIHENGRPVADAEGVRFISRNGLTNRYRVESGNYCFTIAD